MSHLIVQQLAEPPRGFSALLRQLAGRHQLDIFQCRQQLIGHGLSTFARGNRDELERISATLVEAGIGHWLIEPQVVAFAPERIYGLRVDDQGIVFECRSSQVHVPAGATVLAVLADLSGALVDRLLNQILSSNAYRGPAAFRFPEREQMYDMILQARPVLDVYLLDEDKNISAAVRVFPGKYNPQGLGAAATLSSRNNLKVLLQLLEQRAGEMRIDTSFGLDNLPGCQLRRATDDDADALRANLGTLTRYGWLKADLWRHEPVGATGSGTAAPAADPDLPAALLAATLGGGALQPEDLQALTQEVTAAMADAVPAAGSAGREEQRPAARAPLPPPPPTVPAGWSAARLWPVGMFAGGFLAFLVLLAADRSELIDQLAYHGLASGAVPMGVAMLLFAAGFHSLRIKRNMENTPTSRIRSVAMGMVEVKGRAIRKYALVAPMSHTPCVYYRLTRYRRDRNRRWQVISLTGSENVPFLLEDDTGRIEINPAGGRIRAGTRHEGVPGQVGLTRGMTDDSEKWVEETIVEGTLLYVLGFAEVKSDSSGSLREKVQNALRELKQDPQRLKSFDLNGDGQICVDEWDRARQVVAEEVRSASISGQQRRKKQEDQIVIGRHRGRPLLIAETHSETHLAGRYHNAAVGLFLLSAGVTGLAIHLLLTYLV